MDKPILQVIDEITRQPGVTGAVCADQNGMCYAARKAPASSAAYINGLSKRGKELFENEDPIIVIETDSQNILIKNHDDVTVGIFRTPQQ